MTLSGVFFDLVRESCAGAFAQVRSRTRAAELLLGTLCSFGRRTVSRAICALGRQHQDWSADYKLYSRSPWQAEAPFDPVLREYLARFPEGPICSAMDDTTLAKSGRKVKTAFWQRDPLSPKFHVNLLYGLRFTQSALIFPPGPGEEEFPGRSFPVRFTECPVVKKPGKKAPPEKWKEYRAAKKIQNLSRQGLGEMLALRRRLDAMGAADRLLLEAVDGSLCNRTIFHDPIDRVAIVGRCRKDACLCFPAPAGGRRRYAAEHFTPETVRQDKSIAWKQTEVRYGGGRRTIRYKEVPGVLWRRGAGTRPLRLLVIDATPYRLSPNGPKNYREPAYLLATDLDLPAQILLQCYFDRWQIEVNHRDEKEILGVGQAQVWSAKSVPRQPAFAVAAYSLLLLAGLKAFGPGRTDDFAVLPKWRKHAKRPSALDYVTLLRKEINEASVCLDSHREMSRNLVNYAYT
jgi:hypothetical protein